ncbi:SufE family protein [Hyphobacterium marinum]|uniref:SufE family protein n=1 Tax=Hyphobacterium marinum TaxID=3116574 RepID=A0ABU7M0Q6_9PROT|nr:SufE family protein [Hyphobacterium sp. Y6023]MEE2567350.1 SufE family protein [Hyphobacterium sp. Y6023]
MSTGIQTDIQSIIDEFDFLGDWEERYRYLIDLGKALPALPPGEMTDANRVKGCTSQVWLISDVEHSSPPRLTFRAQSDAHIVRGLAALLLRLYSGRTAEEILSVDARKVIEAIGLAEHLSPQRSNGLNSMIARIQREAGSVAA